MAPTSPLIREMTIPVGGDVERMVPYITTVTKGNRSVKIDPQVAASFRELVDSVVVMARKPGEPYRLETKGRRKFDWRPRWGCWSL
jgi:hypothetical protein